MEEILAIIFLFGGGTAVFLAYSPVGKALARRIQNKPGELEQELIGEVQALRDQVQSLEAHAAEMEERLDFAERLLSRGGANAPTEGV